MTGDCHVQFGERLAGKFRCPIHLDIRFEPPAVMDVKTGKNHNKEIHIESRGSLYEWLAGEIKIPDIAVSRATEYDDNRFKNAGIRLSYVTNAEELHGVKSGVLPELGFADTMPNTSVQISSWALETARSKKVEVIDNRAFDILCWTFLPY